MWLPGTNSQQHGSVTFEVKLEDAGSGNVILISSSFRSRSTLVNPKVVYLLIVKWTVTLIFPFLLRNILLLSWHLSHY